MHVEVFFKAGEFGLGEGVFVEVGHEVDEGKGGQESDVDLAQ